MARAALTSSAFPKVGFTLLGPQYRSFGLPRAQNLEFASAGLRILAHLFPFLLLRPQSASLCNDLCYINSILQGTVINLLPGIENTKILSHN